MDFLNVHNEEYYLPLRSHSETNSKFSGCGYYILSHVPIFGYSILTTLFLILCLKFRQLREEQSSKQHCLLPPTRFSLVLKLHGHWNYVKVRYDLMSNCKGNDIFILGDISPSFYFLYFTFLES